MINAFFTLFVSIFALEMILVCVCLCDDAENILNSYALGNDGN